MATLPQAQRANYRLEMQPLRESLVGAARPVILTFLAASLLVLVVACANVAMLMVTRAVARTQEFAVRIALGASRGRLFRLLALETTILAAGGAAVGWWIASVAASLLERQTGLDIPRLATFTTSTPIAAGAGMAVLFVVAACGAAPIGILLGLVASVAFGRAMGSLVFGVKPIDPATGVAATVAVLLIPLGVCYLPARRAAAADPVELLRSE